MTTEDRRIEYRMPADLIIDSAHVGEGRSNAFQASIRELSASGCRIQSSMDMKIGQEFSISFDLEGGHRLDCIHVRVIRRLSHRTHKVVAVEFVDLTEEDQFRIREFIIWKESMEGK